MGKKVVLALLMHFLSSGDRRSILNLHVPRSLRLIHALVGLDRRRPFRLGLCRAGVVTENNRYAGGLVRGTCHGQFCGKTFVLSKANAYA
jgi:hypothetical protein